MSALAGLLESLERELLHSSARCDRHRLESLLAPDFREFGSSGRSFSREAIIEELSLETPRPVLLFDFHCQQLTETVALVTYRTKRDTPGESSPELFLRSSLWTILHGGWQLRFHQGTPVPRSSASNHL